MHSSLKTIRKAAWVSFLASAVIAVYIALSAAEAVSGSNREENVRDIQTITNVQQLQTRALMLANGAARAGGIAMILCRVATVTLLFTLVCSGVTLFQLRRFKTATDEGQSASESRGAANRTQPVRQETPAPDGSGP
jgi:hypothetical protein